MKKSALILTLATLVISCSSLAQESEPSTNVANENENAAVVAANEDSDDVKKEEPQEKALTCAVGYLNYAKGLSKAKQKDEFEVWWDFSDYEYRSVKLDEFKFKDEKSKWLKKYDEALAQPSESYFIHPQVKLGKYDFKKKGFSVEFGIDKSKKTLVNQNDGSSGLSFGGIGTESTSDKAFCTNSSLDREKDIPLTIDFKISNIDKLKFISVSEDKAKNITAKLGDSRIIEMSLKVLPLKTTKKVRKVGALKFTDMVSEIKVQEAQIKVDDEKLSFLFD